MFIAFFCYEWLDLTVLSFIIYFYVQQLMEAEFPVTVFYNRFVKLSKSVILVLLIFLKTRCLGTCTRIFVAYYTYTSCKHKQIKTYKVFKGTSNLG
ncbi:MAG: hypothetical protein EAZ51_06265 [Sphingobacteriales bacterium]|nr:MAG: hypothetical protein EAZ64_08295 [Sphingobacteriales bacterium]TAF80294.1 MAG: hypothetical protein EAZ51_06265 [Sphingobacteriales bacterium]